MKNISKPFIIGLALLLQFLFYACNGSLVIDPDTLNTNFYPVGEAYSWTYKMDSTIYDDEGLTIYNTSSYLRETLIEHTLDAAGDSIYILEIAKRKDTLTEWLVTDLWTLKPSENSIKRTEENLQFVKIVFPSLIGTTWQGNQFDENTEVTIAGDKIKMYENWDYIILDRLSGLSAGGVNYSDVLQIQQADDENLINRRYSVEYYAKDVGLISREMIILDIICTVDCDEELPWEEKGDQGFILKQTLIHYSF